MSQPSVAERHEHEVETAPLRTGAAPGGGLSLFAGPIIAREVMTAPRSARYYLGRVLFVCFLFIVMWTAWQSLIGWHDVHEFGILARFGTVIYTMFAVLQLTVILFFAPIFTAASIAHEKDRRTFVLLLMTDLSDLEVVLGKLLAGLMNILAALAAATGMLAICMLMGGISLGQVLTLFAVTASSGVAGGAMGILVALWRDRTFQSISLTILMVTFSVAGVEALAIAFPTATAGGLSLAEILNPYRAIFAVLFPRSSELSGVMGATSLAYIGVRLAFATLLVLFGARMLRVWNPSSNEPREEREEVGAAVVEDLYEVDATEQPASYVPTSSVPQTGEAGATTGLHVPRRTHRRVVKAAGQWRRPWANPILWRELMTRAYGTKPLIVKGMYILLFAIGVAAFHKLSLGMEYPLGTILVMIPVFLGILSLIIVNAQGVTALTSERDTGALDLLLVTEVTPKEFIYGKLYGVLYNSKEMIALPVLWTLWMAATGIMWTESAVFAIIDFLLLTHFAAMLGLHAAITYTNSRTAVANSLGTIFFLMVGILICAFLITWSNQEFGRQLLSFLIFIGAGSVALFGSLGAKNPSRAIALVSMLTPFWSFYCIISLWRGDVMAAFLFSAGIYGFALLAMLVPAVSDFDIALGRTSAIQG
jgi:ABC-type transport system involved in multi-copper enzyme maturation permease subunit